MKKFLLTITSLLVLFACTPEDKVKIEENINPKEVVATAIELSSHDLTLEKGTNTILTVAYTPSDVTKKDITWVSSNTSVATVTDGIVVGVAPGETEIIAKCGDATDKCKITVVVSATGIKLNQTSLELLVGGSETLIATVEPAESTDGVTWESSDETVATVTNGLVTAIGAGETIITAKVGNYTAECKVTVLSTPKGAVDLGLVLTKEDGSSYTLYWAESNLCNNGLCDNPSDFGSYYAWGESEAKNVFTWDSYLWYAGATWDNGSEIMLISKYCHTDSSIYWGGEGQPDGKTSLDPEDDPARKLGNRWRMPTSEEWLALINQCTWKWKTKADGYNNEGYLVTGPKGSIFLPAAGYCDGNNLNEDNSEGRYWASNLYSTPPYRPAMLCFDCYSRSTTGSSRHYGRSVRPVSE